MKKLIAIVLCLALVICVAGTAFAQPRATAEGATRVRSWTQDSGLYQTDYESAGTYLGLGSALITFIPGVGLLAQTIISIASTALSSAIDASQPCTAKGYVSYRYKYKDGEAYNTYGQWQLEYRTGQRLTYKHTWAAFRDQNGYYKQYTKDYTPTNGYSAIETITSQHYNDNAFILREASTRYWLPASPFNECPF